jgi:hypothetical protein
MKARKYKTIDGLLKALEESPEVKLTYTRDYWVVYNQSDELKFMRYFGVELQAQHPEFKRRAKGYCSLIGIRVSLAVKALLDANSEMIKNIAQYIK